MKLTSFLTLSCLLSSMLLNASPVAWRFTRPSVLASEGKAGWQFFFDKPIFSEEGVTLTIGKTTGVFEYKNLNIDTNKYKYLDIFHRGQSWYPALLVYEEGGSGYGRERLLDFSMTVNDRAEKYRTVIHPASLDKWKGTIKDIRFVVMESGVGSTSTIYGMVFRSGKDTLQNGAFLLPGEKGMPLYWQLQDCTGKWRSRIDVNGKYDLPVWELRSNAGAGAAAVTAVTDLQPDYRYSASIKIKNAVKADPVIIIYDDLNNVVSRHKLQKTSQPDENGFSIYKTTYLVTAQAYRGEFRIELTAGSKNIELSDAMIENIGGAENWRGWWIWGPGKPYSGQHCHFRKEFNVDDPTAVKTALMQASCDDAFTLEVNNNRIMNMNNWSTPQQADVKKYLLKGKNVITVSGYNSLGDAGMIAELKLTDKNGKNTYIATDSSWLCRLDEPEESWRRVNPPTPKQPWKPSHQITKVPGGAWGNYVKYFTSLPPTPVLPELDTSKYINKKTVARINNDLNFPRLEVNNEILSPVIFGVRWRGDRTQSYVTSKASNFRLIRLSWEFSFEAWSADGSVNLRDLENAAAELLRSHPDGYIILEFRITVPPWWVRKYPDEIVRFSDGTTTGADGVFASCSSEIWRREITEKLTETIGRIEKSWYGSRIIGYMPCNLRGPEWVLDWKVNDFPDTSRPMRDYFRKQMRIKYQNNVELLRKAWNMKDVTFDTIDIPSVKLRQTIGYFLPGDRQIVFDYTDCIQTATTDAIMLVMDAIHKSAPTKLRVLYYGYLMTLAHLYRNPQLTSHYDLSRLLASGKVDMMASPISYIWRRPGDISGCGSVEESYKHHKILWLQEADTRTYLTAGEADSHKVTHHAEASIKENRREFIYAMLKRDAIWFYELGGGWYDNAYFHKEFRKMLELYSEQIKEPIRYQTPIAAFFDEKSVLGLTAAGGKWGLFRPYFLHADWQRALAASGQPFDTYELADIYTIDLDKYKVLLFPNAWRKNPRLAKFIREKVLKNNRMVVWIYAPGFGQTPDGLESMRELTNIKFALAPEGTPLYYNSDGRWIGSAGTRPEKNVFCVADRAARPLGFYPDKKSVAAAVKRVGDGWSVYLAANDYSGRTMRQLYNLVKVAPLINTADRVVFDGTMFGVIATDHAGMRTVTLPAGYEASELQEVFTNKIIKGQGGKFSFHAAPGDAMLFRLKK